MTLIHYFKQLLTRKKRQSQPAKNDAAITARYQQALSLLGVFLAQGEVSFSAIDFASALRIDHKFIDHLIGMGGLVAEKQRNRRYRLTERFNEITAAEVRVYAAARTRERRGKGVVSPNVGSVPAVNSYQA